MHFEKAYWQVMAQVEAPAEAVAALLPLLYEAYEAGESVKTTLRNVRQWLPDGTWRWPEYERQLPEMRKHRLAETKKWLDTESDLKSLASIAGLKAFKEIVGELLDDEITSVRKWEQAHKLCETISTQGHQAKALELLRNVVLQQRENKINESDDMLQMLVLRIQRIANGYGRRQQIYEEEIFSYLELTVFEFDRANARPQCIAIEGKALHLNNPYWKDNFPPCEKLECPCRVTAKTERGVQRDGLEIIDKI